MTCRGSAMCTCCIAPGSAQAHAFTALDVAAAWLRRQPTVSVQRLDTPRLIGVPADPGVQA